MIINDQKLSEQNLLLLKEEFDHATPYRHLVIDNFLDEDFANKLVSNFPSFEVLSRHYKGLNEQKSEGANFDLFDPIFSELRRALNEESFRKKIAFVTGIENIFSTEDALGSGIHRGKNGSFLDVHIDFNIHHIEKIHRRLNLLIFLNKEWKEEYGGKLELWNETVTVLGKSYLPIFNRCVIFETSEISYHGYSKINVPETESRKSFYTYYYTEIGDFKEKYHDTIFKARPDESKFKKIATNTKESLKNRIKRFLFKKGVKY